MPDTIEIIESADVVEVVWGGPRGIQGPPGAAETTLTFDQVSASATWDIVHNLGYQPNVTVVDSAGTRVEGDVRYINSNELTVTFASPFAGQAYLS